MPRSVAVLRTSFQAASTQAFGPAAAAHRRRTSNLRSSRGTRSSGRSRSSARPLHWVVESPLEDVLPVLPPLGSRRSPTLSRRFTDGAAEGTLLALGRTGCCTRCVVYDG